MMARTTHRVAYEEAGGGGLTVMDVRGRLKAAAEIRAITTELLDMIHEQV